MTPPIATAVHLAAGQKSAEVTDWAARIGWLVGLVLFIALVYWLMREGWKWRGILQGDLPELPTAPDDPGPAKLTMTGRYHGSTTAGRWLDRIVAHGLGARSRVELTLTDAGLDVVRRGAADFFIPAAQVRGARLDKGIAGKVLTEGGLLIVTWAHGEKLIDSGFRSDRAAEHAAWAEALGSLHGADSPRAASAPQDANASQDAMAPHASAPQDARPPQDASAPQDARAPQDASASQDASAPRGTDSLHDTHTTEGADR